jgi:CheY-like chemotaxis protein
VTLPSLAVQLVESDELRHSKALLPSLARASITLTGLRLLIVDDDRDSRELLRHVLTDRGAEVSSAESSAEALELIERVRPDVLVSDIGMPGEDGYALIRRIRGSGAEFARIPAIALTAYARTEDRIRAIQAGYQVHLSKPVEPIELLAVINSVVQRPRQQTQS